MTGLHSERLVEDLLENQYRPIALPAVVAACYALKLGETAGLAAVKFRLEKFDAVAPQLCLPM